MKKQADMNGRSFDRLTEWLPELKQLISICSYDSMGGGTLDIVAHKGGKKETK